MNTDLSTRFDHSERSGAALLDNLGQIAAALQEVQTEIEKLPFFVRGFVSSEVKKGTGQDIPAWEQAVTVLITSIQDALQVVARSRPTARVDQADRARLIAAAERVAADEPRFAALVDFMEKAPGKLSSVPGGMLPAERRDELVGAIDRQTSALRAALASMPDFSTSVRAIGESAA